MLRTCESACCVSGSPRRGANRWLWSEDQAAPSKPAHPAECKHSDGLSDQTYAMYRRMIEKELPKHPGISLEHIAAESDSSALRTFLRLKDRKGLPRMLQRVLARLRF